MCVKPCVRIVVVRAVIVWLGHVRWNFASWHTKFFPTSLFLFGRYVLNVGGNPPNISTGVLHSAISFSVRESHNRKYGKPASFERLMVDAVGIGNVEINRRGHRSKLWGWVSQHEHRVSDSHRRVHDCAIWPGLAEGQLAVECCGDELNQ